MIHSEFLPKSEMLRRVTSRGALLGALLALAGCHSYPLSILTGTGEASKPIPPAPGLDEPPPNLATVPARPPVLPEALQRSIRSQLQAANASQNGLPAPAGGVAPKPETVTVAAPLPPPVLIGFAPGNAILARKDRDAIKALAARRGSAMIDAVGFAPSRTAAGLHLALLRATAIANELTSIGVPAASIRIDALAVGSGGAAQLQPPTPSPAPTKPSSIPIKPTGTTP